MSNMRNRKSIIAIISLLTVIALAASIFGWHKHRQHQQEVLTQMKHYNDSIEKAQQERKKLLEWKQDSLLNEEKLRFSASTLISEIKFKQDWGDGLEFGQSIHDNWEQNLKDFGFEKQSKKLEYSDVSEFDDELYDIYSIPYTRLLNGRLITVKPLYVSYKRTQDGTWIPEMDRGLSFIDNGHVGSSFEVIFSHVEDKDHFEKSIREIGFTKHQNVPSEYVPQDTDYIYYQSDPNKYQGDKKLPKKERGMCPSVRIYIDSLSFSIQNNVDC